MVSALATLPVFGLPLYLVLGIITFIALLVTAALGILIGEGKEIPFSYHLNMARATIVLAIVHGILVYLAFF